MTKPPKLYSRLTGTARGIGKYQSLWLADGHLMIVTSTGYTESYARLELRDIKGFFITASDRRMGWGIAWGLFSALFVAIFIANWGDPAPPIFSGIFLALSLGLFAWNHLLGPGCRAYAVTGVQTAPLPAIVRMKKARAVLGRLQPLIEAAQADLVPPVPVAPPVVPDPVAPPPSPDATPPPVA